MCVFIDWHFCHEVRLSPQDTSQYLQCLSTLSHPCGKWSDLKKSVDQLGSLDPLQQAYALPRLVELAMPGKGFLEVEDDWDNLRETFPAIISLIRNCIAYCYTVSGSRLLSADPIIGLIEMLPRSGPEGLKRALDSLELRELPTGDGRSYLEADKFAYEIVVLSIIRALAVRNGVQTHTEPQNRLIELSKSGKIGLLPEYLALDILQNEETSFDELLQEFPDDWILYPEYLSIAIKAEISTEQDDQANIERLFNESVKFLWFQKYAMKLGRLPSGIWFYSIFQDKSRTQKQPLTNNAQLLSASLWQNMLWEYAIQIDRASAAQKLNHLWILPSKSFGDGRAIVNALYDEGKITWTAKSMALLYSDRVKTYKSNEEIRNTIPSAICSPWLWDTSSNSAGFARFPKLVFPFYAFRFFAAMCILNELFYQEEPQTLDRKDTVNLFRLFLNFGSALSLSAVQREWDSYQDKHIWSDSLRGLGLFSSTMLNAIAAGSLCPSIPKALWTQYLAITRTKKDKGHSQLQILANCEGMLNCARWVYFADISFTSEMFWNYRSNWSTYERSLCEQLFPLDANIPIPQSVQDDPYALWLLLNTGFWEELKRNRTPDEREFSGDTPLTVFQLLQTSRPEQFWEDRPFDANSFSCDIWPVVLTIRILSEIRHGGIHDDMITLWHKALQNYTAISKTPVLLKLLLLILEQALPEDSCIDKKNYYLILDTIVTVVDQAVTRENAGFLYQLIQNIPRIGTLFGQTTMVNSCCQLIVSLEVRAEKEPEWNALKYLLFQCILAIPNDGPQLIEKLHSHMQEVWDGMCVSNHQRRYKVKKVTSETWEPLTDHFIHSRNEVLYAARKRQVLQRRSLSNRFEGEQNQSPNCINRLGLICSIDRSANAFRVSLNCGQKRQEEVQTANLHMSFRVGDLVVYDESKQKLNYPFMCSPEQSDHDVFCAKLKGISVKDVVLDGCSFPLPIIDRRQSPRSPAQLEAAISIWAPNTLAFKDGQYPLCGEQKCFVSYDAETLSYLPIERDFFHLLLDAFSSAEPSPFVKLFYISSSDSGNSEDALFSLCPGMNYRLSANNWVPDSLERLREEVFNVENPLGMELHVTKTVTDNGIPLLSLDGLVKDNQSFAALFEAGEIYIARKHPISGEYTVARMIQNDQREIKAKTNGAWFGEQVNVELSNDGWSLTQQRKGVVFVDPCRSRFIHLVGDEAQQYRQIEQLVQLKAGDVVRLQSLSVGGSSDSKGYVTGWITDSAIRAFCSVQSISSLPGIKNQASALTHNRMCVVENIYYLKNQNLSRAAVPCAIDVALSAQSVYGIVIELAAVSGESIENSLVKVACIDASHIHVFQLPYSAFSTAPQFSGDLIELRREESGWIADAKIRRINVRALWQAEHHSEGEMFGEYLGPAKFQDKRASYHITQDAQKPIIHVWPLKTKKNMEGRLCGIPLRNEENSSPEIVAEKEPLFTDGKVFPYAKWKSHVLLTAGNKQYWGEANSGDFKKKSSVWTVSTEIYRIGENYFDLRRRFHPAAEHTKAAQENQNTIDKDLDWFQQWIATGEYHLVGTIVKGNKFHLDGHRLPKNRSGNITQEWVSDIPFLQEEPLWYKKSRYLFEANQRARVKMVIQNDQWFASCRRADPFPFDKDLADVFDSEVNEPISNHPLLYAGTDENQYMRFEWGYGYTTIIPSEDVIDMSGNIVGPQIFFGDQINEFMIKSDPDSERCKLCVSVEQIQPSLEHRLWIDSTENEIVQLLRVYVNVQEKTAVILQASLSERRVGTQDGSLTPGWDWKQCFNSRLDQDSVELLLSENQESTEQYIFAMLYVPDKNPQNQYKNQSLFQYISLKQGVDLSGVLQRKRVCLSAGLINTNYRQDDTRFLGNDYFLPFYIPNECPAAENENVQQSNSKLSFEVRVMRRSFSVDESKMRVKYESDNRDAYRGYNMIVYLKEETKLHDHHSWIGSAMNVPLRTKENLIRWVESQSSCLVSLGSYWGAGIKDDEPSDDSESGAGSVIAEVAPGILCMLSREDIRGEYYEGTVARLSIEEETGPDGIVSEKRIFADVLIPSDRTYFSKIGRGVELLIMDDAAKTCNPYLKDKANRIIKYGFTISSFPQIRIRYSDLVDKMIRTPWPRVGIVKEDGRNLTLLESIESNPVRAAMIHIEPKTKQPILKYINGTEKHTEWSKLSFIDRSNHDIEKELLHCAWHYHDKCYGLIVNGTWSVRALPSGKTLKDIIVFPDTNGRLRVDTSRFRQYGYSPREILEYGFPPERSSYPVAGVEADSIWIELLPGRMVELPKALIFIGKQRTDLISMDTSLLSVGDELELSSNTFSFKGGQRELILQKIRFGIRAFQKPDPKSKFFLPVSEHVSGGVVLGVDSWKMTFPCGEPECFAIGSTVVLTGQNEITTNQAPWRGDTVLVQCMQNVLSAAGLEITLKPSEKSYWSGAEWLYEWVRDSKRREQLFDALGGCLPMTVDSAKGFFMYFSYSQKQECDFASGTILCCVALGIIEDRGVLYVLLRSGRQFLRVPFVELLPGFPPEKGSAIIAYLRDQQENIWLTRTASGWENSIHPYKRTGKTAIVLHGLVAEADGIICKNHDTLSLAWLPIEQASFVSVDKKVERRDERIQKIWSALKDEFRDSAQEAVFLKSGAVSLIEADPSLKTFNINTKNRAVPLIPLKSTPMYSCLARFYPHGNMFELFAETNQFEYGTKDARPLPVTITDKGGTVIKGVVDESLHRRIKLLPVVCGYLGGTNETLFSEGNDYLEASRKAVNDQLNLEPLLTNEAKMVYLYFFWNKQHKPHNFRMYSLHVQEQLSNWLERGSTRFLLGALPESKTAQAVKTMRKPEHRVDVCGALAAILLLNFIGENAKNSELKRNAAKLSVHGLRALGIACESSIQQEVLLKYLNSGKKGIYWEKLNALSFGGELSTGTHDKLYDGTLSGQQYARATAICDYILRQGVLVHDNELRVTAMSLSHSMELPVDYDAFEELLDKLVAKPFCWKLARISRALTPNHSDTFAFNELPRLLCRQARGVMNGLEGESFRSPYLFFEKGIGALISETSRCEIEQLIERCIDLFKDEIKMNTP